ncbi:MAG TPA: hypothetical protein VJ738_19545 [Steroidobacteraceae bacterium]|nr:hypothetical protein [Steroidobacteraceae bacterium]
MSPNDRCPSRVEYFAARDGGGNIRPDGSIRAIALGLLAGVFWLIWQAVRATLLALLTILEPIVALILSALALLLTLTAFFWKLVSNRPDFPFFLVLGAGLTCFFALALYRGLIHVLSGRR